MLQAAAPIICRQDAFHSWLTQVVEVVTCSSVCNDQSEEKGLDVKILEVYPFDQDQNQDWTLNIMC